MTSTVISKAIMLVNPNTGRKIKPYGPTHRKLLSAGYLTTITDIDTPCPRAMDIYNHPDVYRIIISFALNTPSSIKTLRKVNKKTNKIVNSLISDKQLVKMVYEQMKGKLSMKDNLFKILLSNCKFSQRFMKQLFIIYPLEMSECLNCGNCWSRYSLVSLHKCEIFTKATGLMDRYEILRYIYRDILNKDIIPTNLIDENKLPLEIRRWPHSNNLGAFPREHIHVKVYTTDKQYIKVTDVNMVLLPSLVQNNVIFAIDYLFIPNTPRDLDFLAQRVE